MRMQYIAYHTPPPGRTSILRAGGGASGAGCAGASFSICWLRVGVRGRAGPPRLDDPACRRRDRAVPAVPAPRSPSAGFGWGPGGGPALPRLLEAEQPVDVVVREVRGRH